MSSKAISAGRCGLLPVEMQNHVAAQLAYAIRARNGHGMRVFERCPAADELDVVQGEILQDALALHFNHFALVVHEIVDRKIFL